MDAVGLKRALSRAQAKGRQYPPELREAVLEYSGLAKQQGKSQVQVAAELGMPLQTLAYWRALARPRGSLTPVAIVADPVPSRERELLVEFGPLRVRGLDVGGLVELFKRLG
jgi:transposase-like protein